MHNVFVQPEISCTSLPNKWLPATVKKTVAPAQICDIDFRLHKVNKCQSAISKPKTVKVSVKSQYTNLTEPSETIQKEFFEKLSRSKYRRGILSIHEKPTILSTWKTNLTISTRGWHLRMLCTSIFVRGQNLDQKFFYCCIASIW